MVQPLQFCSGVVARALDLGELALQRRDLDREAVEILVGCEERSRREQRAGKGAGRHSDDRRPGPHHPRATPVQTSSIDAYGSGSMKSPKCRATAAWLNVPAGPRISSIKRMTELQGSEFPPWLADKLYAVQDDPDAVFRVGSVHARHVDQVCDYCRSRRFGPCTRAVVKRCAHSITLDQHRVHHALFYALLITTLFLG